MHGAAHGHAYGSVAMPRYAVKQLRGVALVSIYSCGV
jgi:hypothetical protein